MILFSILSCTLLFSIVQSASNEINDDAIIKSGSGSSQTIEAKQPIQYNKIEGRVIVPNELPLAKNWQANTRILVNHGEYLGFLKHDNTFEINNLPAGSYLIDVTNPNYLFEPIRVDITSKGKLRARKVNYIQTSVVQQLQYPLRFKPKIPFKYFQARENWKITDFLFNPMVLMMLLPLLLIMLVPRMINVEEATGQKGVTGPQMPQMEIPELSEMMNSLLNKESAIKSSKKKN